MSRHQSFVEQIHAQRFSTYKQRLFRAEAVGSHTDEVTVPFQSNFSPIEMRQLALVAHNHMKPAMKGGNVSLVIKDPFSPKKIDALQKSLRIKTSLH